MDDDDLFPPPPGDNPRTGALGSSSSSHGGCPPDIDKPPASEPTRSRWNPKPEQIMILESIFNSGMVNPPKDETVRIRKLLEKFGAVVDANVFYWFQNRRSRTRRRQRQIQAVLAGDPRAAVHPLQGGAQLLSLSNDHHHYPSTSCPTTTTSSSYSSVAFPLLSCSTISPDGLSSSACFSSATSSSQALASSSLFPSSPMCGGAMGDENDLIKSIRPQPMGFPAGIHEQIDQPMEPSMMWPGMDHRNLHYHFGLITVFINGVPSDVPFGPFDVRSMFGQDVILVHSSGEPVPVNEFGVSLQSLKMGESYFLVSRLT